MHEHITDARDAYRESSTPGYLKALMVLFPVVTVLGGIYLIIWAFATHGIIAGLAMLFIGEPILFAVGYAASMIITIPLVVLDALVRGWFKKA